MHVLLLPLLALLAQLSGLPKLPSFKGRPKPVLTAADSLPTPWKPSSYLALENRFVQAALPRLESRPGGVMFKPGMDPRRRRQTIDPSTGELLSAVEVGEVSLGSGFRRPLIGYSGDAMRQMFRERWIERSRRDLNTLGQNTAVQRQGLSLPIPVQLPRRVQSILGPGGPALNVSGSESIKLSGTSNWTNQQTGFLGQRQSLFPSLDMQQDLDIRLEGQLSDRIKVNLLQNSANQIPLANRIAINYRGDEDDLVQSLDLGNTSLSLPGTQYVSYSGKNEGLFGIKLASRVGPLDLTVLASKQEGRSERSSYSGGASRQTQPLNDYDYVKGQYFLLYDPNDGVFYDIPDTSIAVYLDDGIYNNDINVLKGRAEIDPDGVFGTPGLADTASTGTFDLLRPGADQQYEILNDIYPFSTFTVKVLRLRQPIPANSNQILAVRYSARPVIDLATGDLGPEVRVGGRLITASGSDSGATVLKLLRPPRAQQAVQPDFRFDTTGAFYRARELELRNFYQLSGFGIDPKTFQLTIKRGQDDPPRTTVPFADSVVSYIEVLGLDNFDESTGQAIRGHDNLVDGAAPNSRQRLWVDYKNGVVFFPDPRPFAPRIAGPSAKPFDQLVSSNLLRRVQLVGPADSSNGANPDIYEKSTLLSTDASYYLVADFSASRGGGEISLGRSNLLEGSEAVVVNGERWVRDRDYTIDYDIGRLSLRRQLGPTDQLNVDYAFAPLFQQAGRTLVGSAFRLEGREKSLGGAFLYESKGAQDLRPRLGEEPSRSLITDLNSEWRFRPGFLTRMVDRLPGVRTTTPSEFNVQAEVGMSFPNPNTRNEVFIDDMEGVRDAVSLSLTPERWRISSVPPVPILTQLGRATVTEPITDRPGQSKGELQWYVPINTVKERDLKPKLEEAQGALNPRQVLAITVPRRPSTRPATDTLWAGLTYPLDQVGIDLSRSQFIELWVNDFNDHHDPSAPAPRIRGNNVKLHIDLGEVSEDQMRAPNRPPNGRLDSEDLEPRDNQLVVAGGTNEDTGLDNKLSTNENSGPADLVTADAALDPEGDDFKNVDQSYREIDPRRYRGSNGTEGNKTIFPVPDSEDLNLNERLDQQEAFFRYTVDLGEGANASPYLIQDVRVDFPVEVTDPQNGWRRYRIPLTDSLRLQFGAPDLTIARHVRIWVEGLLTSDSTAAAVRSPLLMLGAVEIVGSRWQATALTPEQETDSRTSITLNAVNSVDNNNIYVPPFDPGETRNGSQALTRREQSMALEFTGLAADDTLEAYKTFSLDENYSRYGALDWYAAGYDIPGYSSADSALFYFVRFASDERGTSYYEVKRRVPPPGVSINWEEVRATLADLSNFKLAPDFPRTDPILYRAALGASGDSVIIKGRPSFTRLRRISFGLINQSPDPGDGSGRRFERGQLWFNELRATDVAKDAGLANRLGVQGKLANLLDYNFTWNQRGADFLSVGETRGSGNLTQALSFTSRFDTHRFFEGTGISLPVSLVYNDNASRPRFTAGDDVVRTGAQQAASETRTISRTLSTSYSRAWSERSNPFLRYTVGGLTGNLARSQNDSRTPQSVSRAEIVTGGLGWSTAPRNLLAIPTPLGKGKFYPLPERIFWNYGVTTNQSESFTRTNDGSGALLPTSRSSGRSAGIDFGADTRPFDFLSHRLEGRRNLSLDLPDRENDRFAGLNLGLLVNWRQSLNGRVSLDRGAFLRPSLNWSSFFNETRDVQTSDLGARAIGNGQNATMSLELPFQTSFLRAPAPPPVRAAGDSTPLPKVRRVIRWQDLVARIGNVSTDLTVARSSSYSRVRGHANPLYMFGLADNPGFDDSSRIAREFGNVASTALDWRANGRTRIPMAWNTALAARLSYGDRTSSQNDVVARTRDWRFPDFDVDYGQVAKVIGLSRFLQNPALRTAYSRSNSVEYQNSRDLVRSTSVRHDFRPLLSVRGRFKNGTDADFKVDKSVSRRDERFPGNSRQTDDLTDVNFTVSRSYSQGQKVTFLGKTSTVRSNINLQLATSLSKRRAGTLLLNTGGELSPIDETRLSVNGTGSYGFSSNVTGNLALGFSENRDNKKDIIRRSVRIELRAQFTF